MDIQIGSDSQTVRMRNMEIGQLGSPGVTISELGVITAKNLYIQGNITSNNANKEIFADVTKDIFIGGAGSRVKVQNLQVGPENSGVTFTSDGTTTIHGTTTVAGNVEVTDGIYISVVISLVRMVHVERPGSVYNLVGGALQSAAHYKR